MFGKVLNFLDRILTFLEEWTLFLSVMVALVALLFNVLLRYSFNYTLAWSEELVREVIIFTTFIGLGLAIKNKSMIKIDALIQVAPRLKMPLTYFSNIVAIIFALMMLYLGVKLVQLQAVTGQRTIILDIPMEYLYSFIPIMGFTILIRTIQEIYQDFLEQRSARSEP
jgi:C4-dicarboxylate transporter, DctQ subunit